MPAVGIGISPFFGGLTPSEAVAYYTRVKAGGGTIDDFSALVGLTLDYKRIASLNPSLYTFASGRKAGTQYSLIPTDGSGDFSVTRSGTTGMELNAQGYWQPVGENVPRYDYVSGVPMINIEEARTNLIARYKSFAHSDWTKSGASIQGDPNTAGADILAGWNFTVGWTTTSATINDSNTFTSTSSGGVYKNIGLIVGKLYKVTIAGSSSVTVGLRNSAGAGINTIGDGFGTYYFIAVDASIYVRNSAAGTTDITTLTVQEVTGYASPFVDSSGNNLMSGYKLVEGTNNGVHEIHVSPLVTAGATYTDSFFIKKGERSWGYLYSYTGTLNAYSYFNLNDGTIGLNGSCTPKIESYGNGWYRCSITYVIPSGSVNVSTYVMPASANGTPSYLGDGTSGILIAHAQLEAGATASSPIGGAEGSTQTRNADVIVKTGASALIGQTKGSILLTAIFNSQAASATSGGIELPTGFKISPLISSTVGLTIGIINTNTIRFLTRNAVGISHTDILVGYTFGSLIKICITYDITGSSADTTASNAATVYCNGVKIGLSDFRVISGLYNFIGFLGRNGGGDLSSVNVNSKIKINGFFNTVISESKAIELTTL